MPAKKPAKKAEPELGYVPMDADGVLARYAWLADQVALFLETLGPDLDDPTPAGRHAIRAQVLAGVDHYLGTDAEVGL